MCANQLTNLLLWVDKRADSGAGQRPRLQLASNQEGSEPPTTNFRTVQCSELNTKIESIAAEKKKKSEIKIEFQLSVVCCYRCCCMAVDSFLWIQMLSMWMMISISVNISCLLHLPHDRRAQWAVDVSGWRVKVASKKYMKNKYTHILSYIICMYNKFVMYKFLRHVTATATALTTTCVCIGCHFSATHISSSMLP